MATPTLSANPNPVAFGGSSTITASFATTPGKTLDVILTEAGVEKARGTVTFQSELAPTVVLGATGSGWEIRSSGGTLSSTATPNVFKLVA